MKPYLWYSKFSNITGKMLSDELKISGGMNSPPSDTNMLICWGMSTGDISHLDLGEKKVCILNHPEKTQNAVNKLRALQMLKENNISVPNFQTAEEIDDNGLNLSFPIIARKTNHQGGRGLFFCRRYIGRALRKGASHFLEFVPSKTEYRIHIFMNRIVRIQEKVPSEEEDISNHRIRNHRYGWRFAWRPYRNKDYPRAVIDEAVKAMNALKLNFGAVDVLWGEDDKPYVLEINTAPALDGSGIESYAQRITNFFEKIRGKLE